MGPASSVDRDRLLQTFLELVAVDSPSGHEREIGDVLEARFGALGCKVTRDEIGNVVAVFPGRRSGTILFSTHMDTVGTDTGIKPIIGDDGVIRTDGSTILGADDKSGIAGCLELLTLLGANPDWECPTIEFVVTVGEEVGLVGSRHMDIGALNASHGFVMDTAGAMGSITYWAPTAVDLTVTIKGRAAHAGVEPEKGINAIKVAAEAIAAMPLGRIDEETVANIGKFTGGDASNIVPDEVLLEGMARSHDQAKLDAQLDTMRAAFEVGGCQVRRQPRLQQRGGLPDVQDRRGRRPVPRSGRGHRRARPGGDAAQVRRRHRRQPLQRQGDPVRRAAHGHGR